MYSCPEYLACTVIDLNEYELLVRRGLAMRSTITANGRKVTEQAGWYRLTPAGVLYASTL